MATDMKILQTTRSALISRLAGGESYDVVVIGGGATGLGVALDAAARGFSVLLAESHDFAKGSSSRATKLVHGGVRYLAQGNISLVREALHERSTLLANAPHLAQPLAFVMPSYKFWEAPFYGIGLKVYDALAGKAGLGPTEFLNRGETLALLPNTKQQGPDGDLKGGVKYWDGQFDDARLAIALARTAAEKGALLLNYCAVTALVHQAGKLVGIQVTDKETGQSHSVVSLLIKTENMQGAMLSLSRSLRSDGSWLYTGHLLKLHEPDGMLLVEKDGQYYFIRTEQKFLVAE